MYLVAESDRRYQICIWCTYSYFGSTLSCKSEKERKGKGVNSYEGDEKAFNQ